MITKTFHEESKLILKGLEIAYAKMVIMKKQKGKPLVVSDRDGRVLKIDPKDIHPTVKYS